MSCQELLTSFSPASTLPRDYLPEKQSNYFILLLRNVLWLLWFKLSFCWSDPIQSHNFYKTVWKLGRRRRWRMRRGRGGRRRRVRRRRKQRRRRRWRRKRRKGNPRYKENWVNKMYWVSIYIKATGTRTGSLILCSTFWLKDQLYLLKRR